MLRKCVRVILSVCLVASLGLAAIDLWALTQNPAVKFLVQRANEEFSVMIEESLSASATPEILEQKLSALLTEEPRNWIVIRSLQDVASNQGVLLSNDLSAELEMIHSEDHGIIETTSKCLSCGWDPKACEISAILLCRAPVDLTPIGDVGGVLRESANYVAGNPVDKIELTLSAVGLGATVLAPMTGGTSLSVKLGAAAIKTTKKLGNLSPGLSSLIVKSSEQAIDWKRLARARPGSFQETFKLSVDVTALLPVTDTLSAVGDIRGVQGVPATLHLMRFVDNAQNAKATARVSRTLGLRTSGAFELIGKSRLLRTTLRYSDEAVGLIIGIAGAITSAFGLVLTAMGSRALSIARKSI